MDTRIIGKGKLSLAVGLVSLIAVGCATSEKTAGPPLPTVQGVDLTRYMGTWFEIASFPQSFQRGCTATTANYELRGDGRVAVVNQCRMNSLSGPVKTAKGLARLPNPSDTAKLEVSFFRPFWGAYWIINLDPEYRYAVVGHPNREYLWILSRTPRIHEDLFAQIVSRAQALGFDVSRLQRTMQPDVPEASR